MQRKLIQNIPGHTILCSKKEISGGTQILAEKIQKVLQIIIE